MQLFEVPTCLLARGLPLRLTVAALLSEVKRDLTVRGVPRHDQETLVPGDGDHGTL